MVRHWGSPLKGTKRPPEVIAKIKETKSRQKRRNAFIGIPRSEEVKRKISEAHRGKILTPEHRKKLSIAHKGKKLTKEQLVNRIGEKVHSSVLTEEEVLQIRKLYREKKGSHRSLAKEFGVSKSTVTAILLRKSWSHI